MCEEQREIDVALDVALVVMENGGSTVRADRVLINVLKGFGNYNVSTLWRTDFVAFTTLSDGERSTAFRQIAPSAVNLLRVSEATALADKIAKGTTNVTDAADEVQRIKTLASPYNLPITVVAAAITAASFSQFVGGDWGGFGICLVTGAIGQFVRSRLVAHRLATAPVTLICAVVSACIAALGLWAHISAVVPATLIGSVGYMMPVLPLVNGFIDVGSHKYLSPGVQRIGSAVFLFTLLAIGIAIAASLVP